MKLSGKMALPWPGCCGPFRANSEDPLPRTTFGTIAGKGQHGRHREQGLKRSDQGRMQGWPAILDAWT